MKCLTLMLLMAFSATAGLNIGTFNIRNFDKPGAYTNKKLLKETILSTGPDLLAVQEIFNESSFRSFVSKELREYELVLSSCGGAGGQNLGFIYKKNVLKLLSIKEDRRLTSAFDNGCGSLRPAMVGAFQEIATSKTFAAIAVHLKAGSGSRNFSRRNTQYKALTEIIEELESKGQTNIVAMGDFNTTGFDLRNEDFRNFKRMLDQVGAFTSADRVSCTSYWGGRDYNDGIEEASTLDHVVYTNNFMGASVTSAKVGAHCQKARCEDVYEDVLGESYQTVSDHCPVSVSFN